MGLYKIKKRRMNQSIIHIKIVILFLLVLSCSSNPLSNDDLVFEYTMLENYFIYDLDTGTISAYCLVNSNIYDLFSVSVVLTNFDDNSIIASFNLTMVSENDNQFSYIGSSELLNLPVGNYFMKFTINTSNNQSSMEITTDTQYISPPYPPQILSVEIDSEIILDPTEWIWFPVDLYASDSNGVEDILRVEYKIKGILISECTGDVEEILEYDNLGNNNWILDFQDEVEGILLYHIDIPFRPINGSSLVDEDGNIIYPETECGKIGEIYFQFTLEFQIAQLILKIFLNHL